ncbi:uncharacterized protein LOC119965660 [Scyliorhinus canicula]|uniref:uncharacterized protein LOC119965660 n=1 Tax=Scyliorhinus canicula TaxID=7830 RepID=UPI0018F34054|nr:uncharacterized protein LOC119965660 [Scyliorhinus canicula]
MAIGIQPGMVAFILVTASLGDGLRLYEQELLEEDPVEVKLAREEQEPAGPFLYTCLVRRFQIQSAAINQLGDILHILSYNPVALVQGGLLQLQDCLLLRLHLPSQAFDDSLPFVCLLQQHLLHHRVESCPDHLLYGIMMLAPDRSYSQMFCSELGRGRRLPGGEQTHLRDLFKASLKRFKHSWESHLIENVCSGRQCAEAKSRHRKNLTNLQHLTCLTFQAPFAPNVPERADHTMD